MQPGVDRELLPFFREQLGIEMQRDLEATYQIMIALDNLDEPIFSAERNGSYSILDHELNRQDAEFYFRKLSKLDLK